MKGHPRAGEETCFPEHFIMGKKKHTIRAGNKWKPGDMFSPRTWMGKPYRSKQHKIVPHDVEVKKVWDVRIYPSITPDGPPVIAIKNEAGSYLIQPHKVGKEIAKNDGLSLEDFKAWFDNEEGFVGQIVCWDESVEY